MILAGLFFASLGDLRGTTTLRSEAAQVQQIPEGFGTEDGHKVYWRDGQKVKNEFVTIDTNTWYFDANGYMVTGYAKINGKSYYFRREAGSLYGAMVKSRFMKLGSHTLYFCKTGDAIVDRVIKIGSNYYGFDENGYRQENMLKTVGSNTYYFNAKGEAERGLRSYNGERYYICMDYTLLKSRWKTIGGKTFYFLKTGKAAKTITSIGGKRYLFQSDGVRIDGPGIKTFNGKKYLLNTSSAILTGWQTYGGETYYFSSDGTMVVSRFMTRDGKKYYLTSKGTMAKGWVVLGKDRYYFLQDGSMATNRRLGSDYVGADGRSYCYQMLAAINEQRAKYGISPLKMNKYLLSGAIVRAPELPISFSHTRPNGQGYYTAVSAAYTYSMLGENIAMATSSIPNVDLIVNLWMNSPGHRANILTEEYEDTGIGLSYQNGGWYWVQIFGTQWI